MDNGKKYGWYSQLAVDNGRPLYMYLDPNYKIVYATTVNNSSEKNPYTEDSVYHDGSKCLGIVTKFIKEITNENIVNS